MVTWTEPLNKRLLELDARNYTQVRMAEILAWEYPEIFRQGEPTRDQVKNALASAKLHARQLKQSAIPERIPYYNKYKDMIEGDIRVEKNEALFASIMAKSVRKVLVLADIHVPYTDEAKLQKAVDMFRGSDILVIAGDFTDSYSLSRWRKTENIPFEVELDRGVRLLEYLANIFPIIYIIPGNHDQRATKKIQDSLPPELFFLFDGNPLELLTRPFPNIKFHDNWFFQVGDAVITHAERSSSIEGRPAVQTSEWFLTRGWAKRFNMGDIRVIVQAHNHKAAAVYREDLKILEVPCMANVMTYASDSSAQMSPPVNGCVNLVQDKGQTIFNESREWVL